MGVENGSIIPSSVRIEYQPPIDSNAFQVGKNRFIHVDQYPVYTNQWALYTRGEVTLRDKKGNVLFSFNNLLADPTAHIFFSENPKNAQKKILEKNTADFSIDADNYILRRNITSPEDMIKLLRTIAGVNSRYRSAEIPAAMPAVERHIAWIRRGLQIDQRAWLYTNHKLSQLKRDFGVDFVGLLGSTEEAAQIAYERLVTEQRKKKERELVADAFAFLEDPKKASLSIDLGEFQRSVEGLLGFDDIREQIPMYMKKTLARRRKTNASLHPQAAHPPEEGGIVVFSFIDSARTNSTA